MQTVIVRHKVANINAWKEGRQERLEIFAPAMESYKVFQDVDDPNSVVPVLQVTDLELLGTIINDPKNKHLKDKHTVLEPITMSMEIIY